MKQKTIIWITTVVILVIVLGYIGITYKQYGKLDGDSSCGDEFEILLDTAIQNGDTSICEQNIQLKNYKYFYYDIKQDGWRWSGCRCIPKKYPDLTLRVDCETNTLLTEGFVGVQRCIDFINEQKIISASENNAQALIEKYDYYQEQDTFPSTYIQIIKDISLLDDPLATSFLINS